MIFRRQQRIIKVRYNREVRVTDKRIKVMSKKKWKREGHEDCLSLVEEYCGSSLESLRKEAEKVGLPSDGDRLTLTVRIMKYYHELYKD